MKYIWILLFFVSCNGQKKMTALSSYIENKDDQQNELVHLISDNYSGLVHPEILIIKEPTALRDFFSQINKTRKPGLAIPTIDFEKELVIIYSGGEQLGVHTPKLVLKNENAEECTIQVIMNNNDVDANATTSPFCLYSMNLTEKKFKFVLL